MTLTAGDIVQFDYDLVVDGIFRETSDHASAEKNGILNPGRQYRPILFTVGQQQIISGLETRILQQHGEGTYEVLIPMAEAFGPRIPGLLRTIPSAQFGNTKPEVGLRINEGQRPGIVIRVGGGRAIVDFNHDLAGKDLLYRYTVRKILHEPREKIIALVAEALLAENHATFEDDHLVITPPFEVLLSQAWPQRRRQLVAQVQAIQPTVVDFRESFPAAPPVPDAPIVVPASTS